MSADVISISKSSHNELHVRLEQQAMVTDLGLRALSGVELEMLLEEAAHKLKNVLDVEFSKIVELLPGGKEMVLRAGLGWNKDVKVNLTKIDTGNNSQAGFTLQTSRPVIVTDLPNDKRFNGPAMLSRHKVVSGMSCIIYGKHSPWGVVGVHSTKKRTFSSYDVNFLQSVANILAMTIQRKQDERALKRSVDDFRHLSDAIPQIVWISGAEGPGYYYNQQWYDYIGMSREEFEGHTWSEFLHPDDREITAIERSRTVKSGEMFEVEYRIREGSSGQYRWFLGRALPVLDDEENIEKWFGTCTDINDKRNLEDALKGSIAQFQALYDADIIGVLFCDVDRRLIDANDVFLKLIGYSREEMLGDEINLGDLTPKEFKESDTKARQELEEKGTATPREKAYIRKDGRVVPVIVGSTMLDDDSKQVIAFVLDITERKRLEQRKDEFIGIASHELKTPLTSIKGYTQILNRLVKELGNEQLISYLERTNVYVDRLNSLVTDLLDVSKIESGKLKMNMHRFELMEMLREAIASIQPTTKKHVITLSGPEMVSVTGDRNRLEQVAVNLLSNAVKYSPNANKVDVWVEEEGDDIMIAVRDYGVGIPKNQVGKVFDRFYRVEETEGDFSGLGIGLYICSEIMSRHGGTLEVESVFGKGATFTVCIPKQSVV